MTFRDNVNQVLEKKGITKSQLADLLKKSRQNVSVILKNNKPSLQTIEEFAAALGVDKYELLLKTPIKQATEDDFEFVDWDIESTAAQYINQPGVRFAYFVDVMGYSVEDVLLDTGIVLTSTRPADNTQLELTPGEIQKIIGAYRHLNPSWLISGQPPITYDPNEKRNHAMNQIWEMTQGSAYKPGQKRLRPLEVLKEQGHVEFRNLGDGRFLVIAPLVGFSDRSRYVDRHSDDEFVRDLPLHAVATDRLYFGNYRSFESSRKIILKGVEVRRKLSENTYEDLEVDAPCILTGRKVENLHGRNMESITPRNELVIVAKGSILFANLTEDGMQEDTIRCSITSNNGKEEISFVKSEIKELYIVEIVTNYN